MGEIFKQRYPFGWRDIHAQEFDISDDIFIIGRGSNYHVS